MTPYQELLAYVHSVTGISTESLDGLFLLIFAALFLALLLGAAKLVAVIDIPGDDQEF